MTCSGWSWPSVSTVSLLIKLKVGIQGQLLPAPSHCSGLLKSCVKTWDQRVLFLELWSVWLSKRYQDSVSTIGVPLLEYNVTMWESAEGVSSSSPHHLFVCVCACVWVHVCLTCWSLSPWWSNYVHECVCVCVHLQSCVPACIINIYSRFPSTNY